MDVFRSFIDPMEIAGPIHWIAIRKAIETTSERTPTEIREANLTCLMLFWHLPTRHDLPARTAGESIARRSADLPMADRCAESPV